MKTARIKAKTDKGAYLADKLKRARVRVYSLVLRADGLEIECDGASAARIVRICEEEGAVCDTREPKTVTLRKKIAARAGLIAAAIIWIAGAVLSQAFVTGVEIVGADGSSEKEIAALLEREGLDGIVPKASVDGAALAALVETEVDGVSLAEAYVSGSKLIVSVRQTQSEPIPPQGYARVVADRYAIVTRAVVFSGTAAVAPGDVVKPGDTLIDGHIDVGTADEPQLVETGADGEIYGIVYYSARLMFSDTYTVYVPTGNTFTATRISVGNKVIYDSGADHGFAAYTSRGDAFTLKGVIPITVERTYYEETAAEYRETDREYIDRAIAEARTQLLSEIGEGTVVSDGVNEKTSDGALIVDIYYRVEQRIGCGEEPV